MNISKKNFVATTLSASQFGVNSKIGNIGSIQNIFIFVFNFLLYIGWLGVIFGVAYSMFLLIFQLYSGDPSEDIEKFKGSLTKAVMVTVLGIIMVGSGFIVKVVGTLFGIQLDFDFWILS